jgi:hypothetical protein
MRSYLTGEILWDRDRRVVSHIGVTDPDAVGTLEGIGAFFYQLLGVGVNIKKESEKSSRSDAASIYKVQCFYLSATDIQIIEKEELTSVSVADLKRPISYKNTTAAENTTLSSVAKTDDLQG